MRDTFNEINITPLTDIFLVLLIIMMVIAPLLDQQGLNLTVPEMVNQEQIKKDDVKILTVMVSSDDKYYLDGEEIKAEDLEKSLKNIAKDYPDGMMIESESDSSHGAVVKYTYIIIQTSQNVNEDYTIIYTSEIDILVIPEFLALSINLTTAPCEESDSDSIIIPSG